MGSNKYKLEVSCASCGGKRLVNPSDWRKRKSDLCQGCGNRSRVGLEACSDESEKGTPLHNVWCGMRQRCGHKAGGHDHDVKHYAERGIQVCQEWRGRFLPFKQWALANGFEEGLILDRKDNDKGYQPDNCRWVTVLISNQNKRSCIEQEERPKIRRAIALGIKQCLLAKAYGVSDATITHIKNEVRA